MWLCSTAYEHNHDQSESFVARWSGQAERVAELIASAGPVLPFDEHAARRYGLLRADLERAGQRVAEPDLRIAAIALARDATLVTGNVRRFARIPDLRVEKLACRGVSLSRRISCVTYAASARR